ncbi:uncharacterized protein V6R79_007236 [Siganus canaliculatus]
MCPGCELSCISHSVLRILIWMLITMAMDEASQHPVFEEDVIEGGRRFDLYSWRSCCYTAQIKLFRFLLVEESVFNNTEDRPPVASPTGADVGR